MTVSVKDIRIRITEDEIHKYVSKTGIESAFIPVDLTQNIWDARFMTSDKNPVPAERCTMDDIEKELEKFQILSESKDPTLYVKTFDKQKVGMAFETREDSPALDSIDEVRSNAKNMTVEEDVPKGEKQIRWYDKSW